MSPHSCYKNWALPHVENTMLFFAITPWHFIAKCFCSLCFRQTQNESWNCADSPALPSQAHTGSCLFSWLQRHILGGLSICVIRNPDNGFLKVESVTTEHPSLPHFIRRTLKFQRLSDLSEALSMYFLTENSPHSLCLCAFSLRPS